MYAYKEFIIHGLCPYCNRDFTTITSNLDKSIIHRCGDCLRGLTILPTSTMKAYIEAGTASQGFGDITPLGRDCCG